MRRDRLTGAALLLLLWSAVLVAQQQDAPLVAGVDGVPVPKRTRFVQPEYPPEAQARGLRGIVILELTIDTQGKVAAVDIVRSIPGLDEAAVAAARKWEYEAVKVDGKPVAVRFPVPITFTMKLPEITRESGIPELRQGGVPAHPQDAAADAPVKVVAELTVGPEGQVTDAAIVSGSSPWAEALLAALRTWVFMPDSSRPLITFKVEAEFVPSRTGGQNKVALSLSGLQRAEAAPAQPALEPVEVELPKAAEPAAAAPATPAPPEAAASERRESAPPAAGQPAPPPPIEILTAPESPQFPPDPAGVQAKAVEPAISAVRDVTLRAGVPELVKGRRPVVPPIARMANTSGTVVIRFAIDAAGQVSVQGVEGPELLRLAAEQTVASWTFRRMSAERVHAIAEIVYLGDNASAQVKPAE
jgi:TonB family protein